MQIKHLLLSIFDIYDGETTSVPYGIKVAFYAAANIKPVTMYTES